MEKGELMDTDTFLLDIFMPELNGIDIARELKNMGAEGKIIFITGGNDYITEAFEIHAFSYIQKPVEYEKFAKVIFCKYPATLPFPSAVFRGLWEEIYI